MDARTRLESILIDRRNAARRIARAAELKTEHERWNEEARRAERSAVIAHRELATTVAQHARLEQAAAAAHGRHERHMLLKPGWWEALTSLGRTTKDWRQGLLPLTQELDAADAELLDVNGRVAHLSVEVSRCQASHEAAQVALTRLRVEKAHLDALLQQDRERYGPTYPGPHWRADDHRRELHGAWLDPQVNQARSDLFRAALDLHLAFLANATGARECLMGSLDVMTGRAPAQLDPAARLAAWQFLFLAVPLVSTTFASAPSMLKGWNRSHWAGF